MTKAKVIDLFAGAGGFSTGAQMAGCEVAWVANHWPVAVEIHAQNHPGAIHVCQDLNQANFAAVPDHDILLASPACQGHSKARGKERAHHDALRSTAWAVISAAEVKRPPAIIVENVPDFLDWDLYPVWKAALVKLGYHVTETTLNAADFGVPQSRERCFVVASKKCAIELVKENKVHIPASAILDLNAGRFSNIFKEGRAQATLRQVEEGRKKHGDNFLIAYYGSEKAGRSLDKPIGTIVTKSRFAIIKGDEMRMISVDECRKAMGFPDDYILPATQVDAIKMLGNAVPPALAAGVIKQVLAAA